MKQKRAFLSGCPTEYHFLLQYVQRCCAYLSDLADFLNSLTINYSVCKTALMHGLEKDFYCLFLRLTFVLTMRLSYCNLFVSQVSFLFPTQLQRASIFLGVLKLLYHQINNIEYMELNSLFC